LQGFSAVIVWTVGQALLVDTVGQKEISQTLGYLSLSMSLGVLVAPLFGGVVYQNSGYYTIYYMAFGLVALDIILRLLLIEKKVVRQWLVDETTDSEGTQDTSLYWEPVLHEAEKPRSPESIIPESTPASPAEHSPQLQVKTSIRQ
jgi:MFS family permease